MTFSADHRPGNLVLGLLLGGAGKNWKKLPDPSRAGLDIDHYLSLTQQAERAGIQTIFLADTVTVSEGNPQPGLEPVTLLSALASRTTHIGLVASISTSFTEPYNVARQIASLDQISRGRAGWNLVTSAWGGENFGTRLPDHDERYAIAAEFAGVVRSLWGSWDADAIVADVERDILVDPSRVHRIDWRSEHFQVQGPLNVPASPQGRPVIAQAGSSDAGKNLGAELADVIFTTGLVDLEDSVELSRDIRRRVVDAGREADDVRILPGVAPVIGSTDAEAERYWEEITASIDEEKGRAALAGQFGGVDFDGYALDDPVPLEILPAEESVQGRRSRYGVLLRLIQRGELRTVRDVIRYHSAAAGHWHPVGSVERIADLFQERFDRSAADGFNILAFVNDYPGGLDAVTEHLIPELQRRGIFPRSYEHSTLRENLGLPPLTTRRS